MTEAKKRYAILTSVLLMLPGSIGQEGPDPLQGWLDAAAEIAEDYIDPVFLDAIEKGDRQIIEQFLQQVSEDFGSDYVLSLADLERSAAAAVPILDQYEETRPYASWLRTRLDYFTVSRQLKELSPTPAPPPGKPPVLPPAPSLGKQRETWIAQIKKEPVPPRAQPHLKEFKRIFREQTVPPELVWVAEVESSFDARARSPVGAAGMFQLMPATARRFGLARLPFDERYRPEPSALAAAKYLRFLHGKFKDWRLALAAYNAGEGRVERLLRGQSVRSYDAIANRLPAETQLYVPKVEATVLRREGAKLSDLTAAK